MRVYDLQLWKRVRREVLAREPLCRECRAAGVTRPAHHVDHVVPISKGGDWFDAANLQALCHECHSRKTAVDEGKRPRQYVSGCRTDGIPIDSRHPWNQ